MHFKSGFGQVSPKWVLYIENRPPLETFANDDFRCLTLGEAAEVIKQTSNHWRKVFSTMAKISFALFETGCTTWQEYRDTKLLTEQGFEAINYAAFSCESDYRGLSILCGYTYAGRQVDLDRLYPHQTHSKLLFLPKHELFVTPYFDWRQLNNELLGTLIEMMNGRLKP